MTLNKKDATVIPAMRKHVGHEEQRAQEIAALVDAIMEIGRHFATLPVFDQRSLEEMLYDENGLPA